VAGPARAAVFLDRGRAARRIDETRGTMPTFKIWDPNVVLNVRPGRKVLTFRVHVKTEYEIDER
jgi:hypothetical protein